MMKLSKFRSGGNGVVTQEILDGKWQGCVWVYRCKKNNYNPIPQVLNVPFDNEKSAMGYGLELHNCGYRVSIRRGKRSNGLYEVQVFFPMGFTVKNAIDNLDSNFWC